MMGGGGREADYPRETSACEGQKFGGAKAPQFCRPWWKLNLPQLNVCCCFTPQDHDGL